MVMVTFLCQLTLTTLKEVLKLTTKVFTAVATVANGVVTR